MYSLGYPVIGSIPPLKLGLLTASFFAIFILKSLKLLKTDDSSLSLSLSKAVTIEMNEILKLPDSLGLKELKLSIASSHL